MTFSDPDPSHPEADASVFSPPGTRRSASFNDICTGPVLASCGLLRAGRLGRVALHLRTFFLTQRPCRNIKFLANGAFGRADACKGAPVLNVVPGAPGSRRQLLIKVNFGGMLKYAPRQPRSYTLLSQICAQAKYNEIKASMRVLCTHVREGGSAAQGGSCKRQTNERTNERTSERTSEQTNKRTNERANEQTSERKHSERTNKRTNEGATRSVCKMNTHTHRQRHIHAHTRTCAHADIRT
jgi:hypothetical protein